jgi:hypothetical protein
MNKLLFNKKAYFTVLIELSSRKSIGLGTWFQESEIFVSNFVQHRLRALILWLVIGFPAILSSLSTSSYSLKMQLRTDHMRLSGDEFPELNVRRDGKIGKNSGSLVFSRT